MRLRSGGASQRGIEQRVRALNAFMYDIYHRQEIIKAGEVPEELVIGNSAFVPEMIGAEPPRGIYSHIIGIDIVRTSENDFFVLEDNTRTPSGVSYMLENRETMMHMFPDLFARNRVAPVENYPDNLLKTLESVAPTSLDREPTIALLTPGIYNSAYFEHSFLADQMGVELVEGQDLIVVDGAPAHEDDAGPASQVDVLYRRIDDDFLDPLVFRPDSRARRAGPVRSLSRRPRHDRQRAGRRHRRRQGDLQLHPRDHRVLHRPARRSCRTCRPTIAASPKDLAYVLEHLAELVVKEVHGSGGYGMLVGPTATQRGDRGRSAPSSRRSPTTTSRSRRWRSRPARRWSRRASRRATSTCGPFVLVGDRVRLDAGRPDARRAEARLARRQLEPGRRHQGHLGAAGLNAREER